jgi:hypothetical protein
MRLGTIAYGGGATLAASLLVIMGFAACSSGTAGGSGGFAGDAGDTGGMAGTGAVGGSGTGGRASGGTGGRIGTGGSAGTGGSGGTGGTSTGPATLGGACADNADCAADLICVTSIGGQTVPGGLCTASCGLNPADIDAECTAIRAGSLCLQMGPPGGEAAYCTEPCTEGVSTACQGRQNAACIGLVNTATQEPVGNACLPVCSNDAQCAPLVCNGDTGFCAQDHGPGTLPIGSPCSVSALTDECANGFCSEYVAGSGFCTAYCRPSVAASCGWSGSGTPAAFCGLTAADVPGPADIGFCAQTCNTVTDCAISGFTCVPDTRLTPLGRAGVCF